MFHLLYLDVGTLSGGAPSAQFELDRLCLHWLIPFSRTEVPLPCEGGERLKTYSHLPVILWKSSEGEHHLSCPIFLSVSMLAPPPCLEEGIQTEGGSGYHSASTQIWGGSGYHPSLKLLQDIKQARAQLEYELI